MAVDVEKIMKDIDNDIKEKGYKEEELSFVNKDIIGADSEAYNYNILCRRIGASLHEAEQVLPEEMYDPQHRSFFQKVIRRMVKKLVMPMLLEEHMYDEKSLDSTKYLFRIIREQQKEIDQLKLQISEKKANEK